MIYLKLDHEDLRRVGGDLQDRWLAIEGHAAEYIVLEVNFEARLFHRFDKNELEFSVGAAAVFER